LSEQTVATTVQGHLHWLSRSSHKVCIVLACKLSLSEAHMACLNCLYHSAAAAPQLDLAPAQSQHPITRLVCKQGHGRLYWEGQLQANLLQMSRQFSKALGVSREL